MVKESNFKYIKLFNRAITLYFGKLGIFISVTLIEKNSNDDWKEQGLVDCLLKLTKREQKAHRRWCMLMNTCQKIIDDMDITVEDCDTCSICKMKCKCPKCHNKE